jgi:hypothetical protein
LFLRPDLILAFLALVVIAGQLFVMKRQTTIADKQTEIAKKQTDLAEIQQKLSTRPNVELHTGSGMQKIPWKLINNGPYKIINVREHDVYFKKFVKSGWQISSSSIGAWDEEVLNPGRFLEIPYASWLKAKRSSTPQLSGDIEVPGISVVIMEIHFQRELDDKEYLLVQPVVFVNGEAWIVKPSESATSGPLKSLCGFEAYAMELMYAYYRRTLYPIRRNFTISTICSELTKELNAWTVLRR